MGKESARAFSGTTPPIGNGKGVALARLAGLCGLLSDSCGRPQPADVSENGFVLSTLGNHNFDVNHYWKILYEHSDWLHSAKTGFFGVPRSRGPRFAVRRKRSGPRGANRPYSIIFPDPGLGFPKVGSRGVRSEMSGRSPPVIA